MIAMLISMHLCCVVAMAACGCYGWVWLPWLHVVQELPAAEGPKLHMDVKLDALMPRVPFIIIHTVYIV